MCAVMIYNFMVGICDDDGRRHAVVDGDMYVPSHVAEFMEEQSICQRRE